MIPRSAAVAASALAFVSLLAGRADAGVGVNLPPVGKPVTVSVPPGKTFGPHVIATDPELAPLTLVLIRPPERGTVKFGPGDTVTYTAGRTKGADSFLVLAADPTGRSTYVTVNVTIPNVAPVPVDPLIRLKAGETSKPAPLADDPNGDAVTLALAVKPKHGTVTIGPSGVSYAAPPQPFSWQIVREDAFTLTAKDNAGASAAIPVAVAIGVTLTGGNGADDLHGGPGDDTLSGGIANDTLSGYAGSDLLRGDGGHDDLRGGPGDDHLVPSIGVDRLDGGDGVDTAYYLGAGEARVDLEAGQANLNSSNNRDVLESIENVVGSDVADTLLGSAGPNVITGGSGDDTIDGRGGDDVLTGDAGRDTLTGGPGADRFVYRSASDSTGGTRDRLPDIGGDDRIDLSAMDGDLTKPGKQGLAFVKYGFTGKPGEVWRVGNQAAGFPWRWIADLDGDKLADFAVDTGAGATYGHFLGVSLDAVK